MGNKTCCHLSKNTNAQTKVAQDKKIPGVGSQPFNSILRQIDSVAIVRGSILTILVTKGSLNLYFTIDDASLFASINFEEI